MGLHSQSRISLSKNFGKHQIKWGTFWENQESLRNLICQEMSNKEGREQLFWDGVKHSLRIFWIPFYHRVLRDK